MNSRFNNVAWFRVPPFRITINIFNFFWIRYFLNDTRTLGFTIVYS